MDDVFIVSAINEFVAVVNVLKPQQEITEA